MGFLKTLALKHRVKYIGNIKKEKHTIPISKEMKIKIQRF